jgi:hypothetical protein
MPAAHEISAPVAWRDFSLSSGDSGRLFNHRAKKHFFFCLNYPSRAQ